MRPNIGLRTIDCVMERNPGDAELPDLGLAQPVSYYLSIVLAPNPFHRRSKWKQAIFFRLFFVFLGTSQT